MEALVPSPLLARLSTLGDFLSANILGQDEVLSDIVSLLQRSFFGLRFPGRPIASMLFLGPTGVGKTETANSVHSTFVRLRRQARPAGHERIHDR